jgi:glycosyltransferase involved in cell wall biosynthesis
MSSEWLRYQRWILRQTPPSDILYRQRFAAYRRAQRPLISVVTPVYNTPPDILRRMLSSVKNQTYQIWEHCLVDDGSSEAWIAPLLEKEAARDARVRFRRRDQNGGIAAASNDALALATGEFVAFVDHDDEIEPDALDEVVRAIETHPGTDAIYTDFDILSEGGARQFPAFWPDWSPERLECLPYTVHLRVYRRAVIAAAGGLRPEFDGAQDYDLALRVSEITDRIVHIPRVLYHWRINKTSAAAGTGAKPYAFEAGIRAIGEYIERQQIPAVRTPGPVPGLHALDFDSAVLPPVSIIVALPPDADALASGGPDPRTAGSLAASLTSLLAASEPAVHEVVVVVPQAQQEAVRSALESLPPGRARVVMLPDGLSHTAALNTGARQATGDVLLFLGEDLEAAGDAWLRQLAGYVQRPPVGAVGPKIYAPSGEVHHAGIVLPRRRPHPAHRGEPVEAWGFYWDLQTAINYTAVSGACLATRRAIFEEVGGFRSAAEVGYSDVDYCLRLRERGYRVVFVGYAELRQIHEAPVPSADVEQARLLAFQRTWPALPEVDPYYNPNFNQGDGAFTIGDC